MTKGSLLRKLRPIVGGAAVLLLWAGPARCAPISAADSSRFEIGCDRASELIRAGRFAAADSSARLLLAWADSVGGPSSPRSSKALDLVVWACREAGRGSEPAVRDLAERSLRLHEQLHGADSVETAAALYDVGFLLLQAGRYQDARSPLERSLATRRRRLPANHSNIALGENALGILEDRLGNLDAARARYERALSIRLRADPPDSVGVANSYNNIAGVLTNRAEYDSARVLFQRVIAIRERALGHEDRTVATALGNLGRLEYLSDRLAEARGALVRALDIYAKNGVSEKLEAAFAWNQLGLVLREEGDLWGAKDQFEHAVRIREHLLGVAHPTLTSSLTTLADVVAALGDSTRADSLLERSLHILEASVGPDHLKVADAAFPLARLRRARGDLDGARALDQRALTIWEHHYGAHHQTCALALRELAGIDRDGGRLKESLDGYANALALQEGILGPEHSEVATTLEGYALSLLASGDSTRAIEAALRCERVARDYFRLTSRALSEREALRFADARTQGLSIALSALSSATADSLVRDVWDSLVRSRALVLDEMAGRRRTLAGNPDTTVARLERDLVSASRDLSSLMVEGPDPDVPGDYTKGLAAARSRVEQIERDLADRSAAYRGSRDAAHTGLEEVERALPAGSALVAFARFERPGPTEHAARRTRTALDGAGYIAFVLDSRHRTVVIPIGTAARVENSVARWFEEAARGALRSDGGDRQSIDSYRRAGERLRNVAWDPLARAVGTASVFVVPDGSLHLVALGALPDRSGGYLIESGPVVHYLSAERDLVADDGVRTPATIGLLAIGGADFDDRSEFSKLHHPRHQDPVAAPAPSVLVTFRGTRSASEEFRSVRFGPLPASNLEVRDVVRLWRGNGSRRDSVVALSGKDATEAAFKSDAPFAADIHLATHGFFLGGERASSRPDVRGIGGLAAAVPAAAPGRRKRPGPGSGADRPAILPKATSESPLLLSGLALAGANHRDAARPDEEDGILTAEEIAAMDLTRTKLAVLSACDTGRGEIRAGEGVLGLRRAFRVAGGGALVMSLWELEDAAAREWVRFFYEARLSKSATVDESARQAALASLRERRARGQSVHPFFWAGFLSVDGWR